MRSFLAIPLILAGWTAPLPGATLQRLSLDDMINKATLIVRGKVQGSATSQSGPVIYTNYQVQVTETLKGAARSTVTIQMPGGVAGNMRQTFAGVPQFSAGDEFVFFLWSGSSGTLQLLGLTQGLFSVAAGGAADPVTTRAASHEVMLDRSTGKQVKDQALTMRMSDLRTRISTALAAQRMAK